MELDRGGEADVSTGDDFEKALGAGFGAIGVRPTKPWPRYRRSPRNGPGSRRAPALLSKHFPTVFLESSYRISIALSAKPHPFCTTSASEALVRRERLATSEVGDVTAGMASCGERTAGLTGPLQHYHLYTIFIYRSYCNYYS